MSDVNAVENLRSAVRFWRTTAIMLAICAMSAAGLVFLQSRELAHQRDTVERALQEAQKNLDASEAAQRKAEQRAKEAREAEQKAKEQAQRLLYARSIELAERALGEKAPND